MFGNSRWQAGDNGSAERSWQCNWSQNLQLPVILEPITKQYSSLSRLHTLPSYESNLKMEEASIGIEYLAVGANRHTSVADWSKDGLVAFGADSNIEIWQPTVCERLFRTI